MASVSHKERVLTFYPFETVAAATAWTVFYLTALRPLIGHSVLSWPLAGLIILFAAEGAFSRAVKPTLELPRILMAAEMLCLTLLLLSVWIVFRGDGFAAAFRNPLAALHFDIVLWIAAALWAWQLSGITAHDQAVSGHSDFAVFTREHFLQRLIRMTLVGVALVSLGAELEPGLYRRFSGYAAGVALSAGLGIALTLDIMGRMNMKRRLRGWHSTGREVERRLPGRWRQSILMIVVLAVAVSCLMPARFSPLTLNEGLAKVMHWLKIRARELPPEQVSGGASLLQQVKTSDKLLLAFTALYGGTICLLFLWGFVQSASLIIWLLARMGAGLPDWLERLLRRLREYWSEFLAWFHAAWASLHGENDAGTAAAESGATPWHSPRPESPDRSWVSRSPRHLVRYLYFTFVEKAAERRMRHEASQTPSEFRRQISEDLNGGAIDELNSLTAAYEQARYAEPDPDPASITVVRRAWAAVMRALGRGKGR